LQIEQFTKWGKLTKNTETEFTLSTNKSIN